MENNIQKQKLKYTGELDGETRHQKDIKNAHAFNINTQTTYYYKLN